MMNVRQNPFIILASKSPRRKYLLEQVGLPFCVIPSQVDEKSLKVSSPEIYVQALAKAKAMDVAKRYPKSWVIGADTIVCIDNEILGKPKTLKDARQMLLKLSGRTHKVFTGFAIVSKTYEKLFSQCVATDVQFKKLTETEIEWYIQTKEPFDKAGAYAIQGLGTFLVKRICGSYTSVVGLPVCEVIAFLIKEKVIGLNGSIMIRNEDLSK
jgi:septum formation protein